MNKDRLLNTLSMAARARRITSGVTLATEAIKKGEAKLILLASDAEDETKKDIYDLSQKYSLEVCEVFNKETLGGIIGKAQRAVVAILDAGFSEAIKRAL
ncbi:MAG: ribosomal L7Ae/L30e/S12e/Gadd45 family protein [Selenomonadaceae bacterium]|nr:ribosomal L7Ae/L30e/S12e/Gadd45 family protein [Selenomonadaceae bacterium]